MASFSSELSVAASPREPQQTIPVQPLWIIHSQCRPSAAWSTAPDASKFVVIAGMTPFQFITGSPCRLDLVIALRAERLERNSRLLAVQQLRHELPGDRCQADAEHCVSRGNTQVRVSRKSP